MTMPDYRVPESKCPFCFAELDRACNTDAEGGPRPGDMSICLYCARILKFGPMTQLVLPTPEDFEELMRQSPETILLLMKNQRAVRQLIAMRSTRN